MAICWPHDLHDQCTACHTPEKPTSLGMPTVTCRPLVSTDSPRPWALQGNRTLLERGVNLALYLGLGGKHRASLYHLFSPLKEILPSPSRDQPLIDLTVGGSSATNPLVVSETYFAGLLED